MRVPWRLAVPVALAVAGAAFAFAFLPGRPAVPSPAPRSPSPSASASASASAAAWRTVAEIDTAPVTAAEFSARMAEHRAAVARHFHATYGADVNAPGFWTRRHGAEVPGEVLRRRTLETLTRVKVQQLMAREAGLPSDLDYPAFLARMAAENQDRGRRLSRGEPLYGPQQYTERTYFAHSFGRMVLALRGVLGEDRYPSLVEARVARAKVTLREEASSVTG